MSLPQNMAISCKNVTKQYRVYPSEMKRLFGYFDKKIEYKTVNAANDISFDLYRGEVLGVIGKNGAGKSTLLKMITGVTSPTTGTIEINGRLSSLLELGTGFNPELTGYENIFMQGGIMGISQADMQEKLEEILEFADIGDFINQPVKNYSSGMFARLAFSVAISVDPDILIVDEILSVGDAQFQQKCIEKIKFFSEKGVTILFVSHNILSLSGFCNRAIWIEKGELLMDGSIDEVSQAYLTDIMRSDKHNEDRLAATGLMKIEKFSFNQENQKIIDIHSEINFEITFTSADKLPQSRIYFGIKFDGVDLRDIISYRKLYDVKEGENTFRFSIPRHNLNPGVFNIIFGVSDQNSLQHYVMGQLYQFEVKNFAHIATYQEGMVLTDMVFEGE
ncbi:MAG: ABC transporter ATP-binding protein [Culicoidibacterales bacterium]